MYSDEHGMTIIFEYIIHFDNLDVQRSQKAVHDWVQKADI
jgi:hypothetical protein